MSETKPTYEVAVRDAVLMPPTWKEMRDQARVLHQSKFFPKSIKSEEGALAIMLAGRELGLGAMESLRSIYIVDGQTTISSGLMGAMIWQAGHAYNIDESTDAVCQITFTRNNGQTYTHRFTHEDAVKAKLAHKDNWQKYEKAMLFNRCMSAGGRAFMPDVFRKMYTPEELGAAVTVSESGDVVIDAETRVIEDEPEDAIEHIIVNGKWTKMPPRPLKPAQLKEVLEFNVSKKADWTNEPNKNQIGLLASKLEEALGANQDAQVNRYTFTEWMTGERSLKLVGLPWIATLLDWLLDEKNDTGDYPFKAHAVEEANLVLRQAMLDQGQQELPTEAQFDAAPQEQLDGLGFGK